jgi:DNA-binding transcriptional MerR regulator
LDKSPDAFRTISEVAEDLDLPQHVLRFWETRFAQIRPLKRGGGRRYYRPDDVALLRGIKHLLYGEGYTIRGVQRILRDHGPKHVVALSAALADRAPAAVEAPAPAARREPVFDDGAAVARPAATDPDPDPDADTDEQAAPAASVAVQGQALAKEWPQAVLSDADLAPGLPPVAAAADEHSTLASDDSAEARAAEPSPYAPRLPATPAQAVPASERRLSYAAVRSLEAVLADLIECRALLGRET